MNIQESPFNHNRVRVVDVVTSSLSLRLFEKRPECFAGKGYEVTVVSSAGEELRTAEREGVRTIVVEMAREIEPLKDLGSLWELVGVMRRLRPTITNVGTPKAGLLGGAAALLCGVPCRYYTLYGLRCETTRGLKRQVLLLAERIACACAERVICVSESLRQKAIALGIVDASRTTVLAGGSSNGIDAKRFAPTTEALQRGRQIREKLGIPANTPVIGFVGRLTKDKGISELVEAYLELRNRLPALRLLLVGEIEEGDPLPARIRGYVESEPGILRTGFVADPTDYYHVMDALALPTYREGFPTVVLEANAAGKPVVAAAATGVVDAVVNNVTGMLVPVGDAVALASALELLLQDRRRAASLGAAGRERVLREYRQERAWDALEREYSRLLEAKGLSAPIERSETAAGWTTATASR